jgi:hypothetical protein
MVPYPYLVAYSQTPSQSPRPSDSQVKPHHAFPQVRSSRRRRLASSPNHALLSGPRVRHLVDRRSKRLTRTLSSRGASKWIEHVHHRFGVETRAPDNAKDAPSASGSRCPEPVVHLDVHMPIMSLVANVAVSPEVGGEVQGLAAIVSVVLVGPPVHAEGVDVVEKFAAEVGDGNSVLTAAHGDDEVVFRRIVAGRQFEHGVAFVVDLLAGSSEGVARSCGLAELDVAVFICLYGEEKFVDLIARLCGELEQGTVGLGVQCSRWLHHGCFWRMLSDGLDGDVYVPGFWLRVGASVGRVPVSRETWRVAKTKVDGSCAMESRLSMERRLEQNTFSRENSRVGGAKGDGSSKTEIQGKAAKKTGR